MNNNNTNSNVNLTNNTINEMDEISNNNIKNIENVNSSIPRLKSTNPNYRNQSANKRIKSAFPSEIKPLSNLKSNNQSANELQLYDENNKLKLEISKLKNDFNTLKLEVNQLEFEIEKKEKIIDDISSINNIPEININLNNCNDDYEGINFVDHKYSSFIAKILDSKIVISIKRQYKEIKKELAKKNEEIAEMKKLVKLSKNNELTIENQTLKQELLKLQKTYKNNAKDKKNIDSIKKDLEFFQENYPKQQFIMINLQEQLNSKKEELSHLTNEILKSKNSISEKNKKIDDLNRYIKGQAEYIEKLNNFKELPEFKNIKNIYEKKISDLKKDLQYFKSQSDKNESRKKDLEEELKRLKTKDNKNIVIENNINIEENIANIDEKNSSDENKVLIYKSKLLEKINEIKLLENENRELKEKLGINCENDLLTTGSLEHDEVKKKDKTNHNKSSIIKADSKKDNSFLNHTYLTNNKTKLKMENTNISTNLQVENSIVEKDVEISTEEISNLKEMSEDTFNEVIYILMKNFEAKRIDSSVIESAFPESFDKYNSTAEIVQSLSKSIMYLLKK